jgi:hypothetical protein
MIRAFLFMIGSSICISFFLPELGSTSNMLLGSLLLNLGTLLVGMAIFWKKK